MCLIRCTILRVVVSINCIRGTPTENLHRLLDHTFHKENFGTIDIDWAGDDPKIRVSIVDLDGKQQMSHAFHLSELRPSP